MKYFLPFILLFLALPAHAATVRVEPSGGEAPPATPFTVTVMLTTDANPVNVVEGSVRIPAGVTVDSVSAAGSAFSLWPTYPAYVTTDHAVEFSGGVPGGVAPGVQATLFTIRAHADAPGVYAFAPSGMSAYQNDGKGSAEQVMTSSATVTVRAGAASPAVAAGKASPLVADIGRDDSLFGGRYFLAFYGGDRGAGVRYEVREGNGPYVAADRYYVLRDQTLHTQVTVRAIDDAGVVATRTVNAGPPYVLIALAIIVLVALGFWFLKRRRASAI